MLKFENVTGITKKGKEDDFKLQDISFGGGISVRSGG